MQRAPGMHIARNLCMVLSLCRLCAGTVHLHGGYYTALGSTAEPLRSFFQILRCGCAGACNPVFGAFLYRFYHFPKPPSQAQSWADMRHMRMLAATCSVEAWRCIVQLQIVPQWLQKTLGVISTKHLKSSQELKSLLIDLIYFPCFGSPLSPLLLW